MTGSVTVSSLLCEPRSHHHLTGYQGDQVQCPHSVYQHLTSWVWLHPVDSDTDPGPGVTLVILSAHMTRTHGIVHQCLSGTHLSASDTWCPDVWGCFHK